jgi:outer membrane protein TolC
MWIRCGLTLLVPLGAAAQEGGPVALTLDEALRFAERHHPRILAAAEEVHAREADARVPGKRWMPKLGVTAQAVVGTPNNTTAIWLSSRGAVELPRIANSAYLKGPSQINWSPYLSTVVGAGFEQEIFDFGRIAAERAVADARALASRSDAAADRLDVALAVREAFYAVEAGHGVLAAAMQVVERAKVHEQAICALAREGLRADADCQRSRADLARYQAAQTRAEGALSAARTTLAAAIGSEALEVEVEGTPAIDAELPPLTSTVAEAVAREPRLQAVEDQAKAQGARVRASKAELRPQVYAIGSVLGAGGGAPNGRGAGQFTAYGKGGIPWTPNYYAGLVMAWNMLDGPALAQRDAAEAEAKAARKRVDDARHQARSEAAQAWAQTQAALKALPEYEQALHAAEISYQQMDGRYSEGLATIVELTDAEALRVDAQINLAVGKFEAARSRARLDRALAKESRR